MSAVYELLSKDNVVFRAYAFWVTVLLLKTLAMSILTGLQRFRTKVRKTKQREGYQIATHGSKLI